MDEINEESEYVNGDLDSTQPQQSYALGVTEFIRAKAKEWFNWDVALEVVSDGYDLSTVYPDGQLEEGRRKMQASVLNSYLGGCCFDPQKFPTFV